MLTGNMSQEIANGDRVETVQGENRRSNVILTARERASTESIQIDFGPVPQRTLEE